VADDKKPNAITRYVRETTGELRKVSWPTWPEARQLTIIVVGVMTAMALLLGLVDRIAEILIGLALGA
jgi:preprotein translocase subunit SecE